MTTEVELQQYFFPLVRQVQQSGTVPPIWNVECSIPRPLATAPSVDPASDDNGNYVPPHSPGVTTRCLTEGLIGTNVEEQHCLANFLSSGDRNDLRITDTNIHYYLQFAGVLHHKALETLCEEYLQNNKNKSWEHDSCFTKDITADTDKDIGNNNKNVNISTSGLNFPKFQILFLKQFHTDDHIKVLVMDVRKLNADQTILDVKKVSRFEDGFACCTAYHKQCPYILFSGRHSKKDNALIKYDVVGHKWLHCSDMKYSRAKHMMAFSNKGVYIIGGKKCSAVEKYNIADNHCTEVGSLPVGVHSAALAVFENKVFVFGGKHIRGNVTAVQCINTDTNTIARLPDLPFESSGGQAIVVKDKIYLATSQGHLIKFDPVSNQSELCSQQPYRRKHFVMFEKENNLHLFGGLRTDGRVDNETAMFMYSPVADEWKKSISFGTSLPVQASCTVSYPKECPVKPFSKLFGYY